MRTITCEQEHRQDCEEDSVLTQERLAADSNRLRRLHEALTVDFNEIEDILEASEYNLKMDIIEGWKETFVSEMTIPYTSYSVAQAQC